MGNVPCKLLSIEIASRSPSSLIHHKSVFRCLSIDGARLGHLVLLDRGVEADCALRRFAVPPVHLSSHLCRCRAVLPVTLPFFLTHTVCWIRKVSECCRTGAPVLYQGVLNQKDFALGKELENVVYGFIKVFGTSFSGCLLIFGYFCCFLACDLALPQVLCSFQPYS